MDWKEPYRNLKTLAAPILDTAGYKEIEEHFNPEVMGSAYSEWANGEMRLRVIWDGREAWGCFEKLEDGNWRYSKSHADKQALRSAVPVHRHAEALLQEFRQMIAEHPPAN